MIPSEIFLKWLAKPLVVLQAHAKLILAATLSTADFLLRNLGFYVIDLNRIKEAKIEEIEAEVDKKVLEAVDIANRITLSKRNQAIEEIERLANAQKTIAEAKKIMAETKTIETKTEILKQVSEAKEVVNRAEDRLKKAPDRLLNALRRLQKEGGEFYVDSKQLKGIIQRGLPAGLDQDEAENDKEKQTKKKPKSKKPKKKK